MVSPQSNERDSHELFIILKGALVKDSFQYGISPLILQCEVTIKAFLRNGIYLLFLAILCYLCLMSWTEGDELQMEVTFFDISQ